jgi:murein L,D-transpeptidase YafK
MRRTALVGAVTFFVIVIGAGLWAQWPVSQSMLRVQATRVLVEKHARRLTLLYEGGPIKTYRVALGRHPEGPKSREGDGRTPEGLYLIDSRLATSGFHRALHVSYPNASDQLAAKRAGLDPGGAIFIHGIKNRLAWLGRLHRFVDWTAGCIAVTNAEIDEIWRAVPDGTVVEIRP